jgi:ADP-ribosylglycohydrolase
MKDNAQAMVMAAFAADSLALAAHWIYDTTQIDREFGIIDQLLPPVAGSYHGSKQKGDFTHYGDQSLILLRHLAENNCFDLNRFANSWQQFCRTYNGYIDSATRKTLAALDEGKSARDCGSGSSDLGGPARIAPLIYWYRDNPDSLMSYAHQQTHLTHTGNGITATTDFIIGTTLLVLGGTHPAAAIEQMIEEGIQDIDLDLRLRKSIDTVADDSRKVIADFGQMCGTSNALPGAVHLILAYQDNLREALIQNVMAGGDSAARGMVIGTILGAYQGMEGLEEGWLADLRAREDIVNMLAKAPVV